MCGQADDAVERFSRKRWDCERDTSPLHHRSYEIFRYRNHEPKPRDLMKPKHWFRRTRADERTRMHVAFSDDAVEWSGDLEVLAQVSNGTQLRLSGLYRAF